MLYQPNPDNAHEYEYPAQPPVLSTNGIHQAQQDARLDVLEGDVAALQARADAEHDEWAAQDAGEPSFTVAATLAAVGACREELAAVRPVPTALDSILFAMTELAEYVEAARLRPNAQYIRNNERQFDERRELAQVGEMIATAMWVMDTEPTSKDAGGILVGRLAGAIAYALGMWARGRRAAAWLSLEAALATWGELCSFVGEDRAALIEAETARLRGKFGAK